MEGFDKEKFPTKIRRKIPTKETIFVETLSKLYSKSIDTINHRLQLLNFYLQERIVKSLIFDKHLKKL